MAVQVMAVQANIKERGVPEIQCLTVIVFNSGFPGATRFNRASHAMATHAPHAASRVVVVTPNIQGYGRSQKYVAAGANVG
jgi:hypothetical protein